MVLRRYFGAVVVFCSFFVVPAVGDIFGTITNVQWFTQFAIAVACLVPGGLVKVQASWVRGAGYAALVLAALSGPFSVIASGIALMAVLAAWLDARLSAARSWWGKGLLTAVAAVGRHINMGPLLVVTAGACIQVAVMVSSPVNTPWREMLLSAPQQRELQIHELRSPYVQKIAQWRSTEHLAQGAAVGVVILACLIHAFRNPSFLMGLCCVLLVLGGVQPVLAFAKQRELHVFAASSHYFYLLSVASCWVAWALLLSSDIRF